MALLSALGVALAVGLAVSVPVFAQAVSRAIMEEELDRRAQQLRRSPLLVRHYLLPSSDNPLSATKILALEPHIDSIYRRNLGIGVRNIQIRVESGGMLLRTAEESSFGPAGTFLGDMSIGFLTGLDEHVEIIMGDPLGAPSPEDAINVWMHEGWAHEIGVQPGERFAARPILGATPVPVRIAGVWAPRDPQEPFWPTGGDSTLRTLLLVGSDDYAGRVEPFLGRTPVGSVSWLVDLEDDDFVPELAERYVGGLDRAEAEVRQMLNEVRSDMSPRPILQAHLDRQRPLMILLFGFMVPILGFLLYFLALVSRIVVENQSRVMATVVSRGLSSRQLLQIHLYQGLIILALGTPLGIVLGLQAARVMGHVSSFLEFAPRSPLNVSIRGINPSLILVTMAVALLARLWPGFREARWGMIEYVRRNVRLGKESLLYRLHLELLLLIPTLYLYQQLRNQGSIALLGWHSTGDVFADPAPFLVPALFMLTMTLVAARVFPLLMWLLDHTVAGFLGVVGCLTLRQMARRSRNYIGALLLIMVSVSVGVFMSSMALSLDRWVQDRAYYPLGADIVFAVEERSAPDDAGATGSPSSDARSDTWLVPRENLTQISGIEGATWVGRYRAVIATAPSETARGWFMAIDRRSFPEAAVFRSDFGPESLGAMMNRLGSTPNGVLVPQTYLTRHGWNLGDTVTVRVSPDGAVEREMLVTLVGAFDYFPTVFEDEAVTMVGNLDYLLTTTGGVSSYDVWLRADMASTTEWDILHGLHNAVPQFARYRDVWSEMAPELEAKERIGVYGTLSLGFLAALTLSGIGLLIQYQRSLHERLSRFATLRAIGLGRGQLFAQVQLEYVIVLAIGLAAGVAIGIWASHLFIPHFRVATPDGTLPIPPLLPLVDYERIIAMGVAFGSLQILAQLGLIWRSMRTELFQVLRMGEQE